MTDINQPTDDLEQLKRAVNALKKARARIDTLEQMRSEPIAIIGIGCRLPGGANTPQAFWELLRSGTNAVVQPPPGRWEGYDYLASRPDEPGKMQSALGGFLDAIDQFDPHFFGISPREAHAMDPQQRLALETAWEALEDAGIIPATLAGSLTGVFIGIGLNDYARLQIPMQAADATLIDSYFIQGNALCISANRISYALDLRGPSMAIDTACSSSLVAIHTACQSLRNGDSSLVLAGGSNILLAPDYAIGLGKFLAPDGLCKTFDSRANGYTRGEGVVMFVMKRLSDALSAGDRIYAVIRGSAINQDGFSSGLTVPNGDAQEAMLRAALHNAGVQPEDIDYVEAHGTGTSLGDPIEANALGAVFASTRKPNQDLLIGSVKTNIGHLEAGAGIAGVLKVILAMFHGAIPPSLNFIKPNPLIDFDRMRLRVVTQLTPWTQRDHPPRAGVSAFGFGGANSHVIVEAAPAAADQTSDEPGEHLFTLSARTPQALTDYAQRYADFLIANATLSIADVCHTANRRRSRFSHRLAIAASDLSGLSTQLAAYARNEPTPQLTGGQTRRAQPKLAFLFTGQGAQYAGMGRQLYEKQPVFRAALDRCEEVYRQQTGESLLAVLFEADSAEKIDHTAYTQPALFAIEYALAEQWRAWGITPDVVIGHSVGEYVAACVSGVMSLEDGLKLITARARLMGSLPAGGVMAAVFAPLEQVESAILSPLVSIGAVNAPDSIVISGAAAEVQAVLDRLAAQGIKSKPLVVSHAFHSVLMEPILDEFAQVASACKFNPPRIPLVSNITGKLFTAGEQPDAAYWRRHVRSAVNFAAGMQTLQEQGVELFLEIGPHPVLLGLGKRCLPENYGIWLPSLRQNQPETTAMLKSLGGLWCQGIEPDWNALESPVRRAPVSLPTYPFQHERYWFSTPAPARAVPARKHEQPLLGARLRSPLLVESAVYETQLHPVSHAYLWDHRAYENALFPAAGYIDMILSAASAYAPERPFILEDLTIQESLVLPDDGEVTLQTALTPQPDGSLTVNIYSVRAAQAHGDDWTLHAAAKLIPAVEQPGTSTLADAQTACPNPVDPAGFYENFRQSGMQYGAAFQNARLLWHGVNQALGRVTLSDPGDSSGYSIHPALLDACLQVVGLALPEADETYLPIGFDQIQVTETASSELWSFVKVRSGTASDTLFADVTLYTVDGGLAGQIHGMRLKRASRAALQRAIQRATGAQGYADWLYQMEWQPMSLPTPDPAVAATTRWLIISNPEQSAALAAQAPKNAVCRIAHPGSEFQQSDSVQWRFNPALPQDMQRLLAETHPQEIILANGDLQTALHLLQAATALPEIPAVWIVTQGAQPVQGSAGGSEDVSVEVAALWGFARSAKTENSNLTLRCVDLDPAALPDANARLLWKETHSAGDEDEIGYRNDTRYVHRMTQWVAPEPEKPVRLEITTRGSLENLALRPMQRRPLQAGEVEIRVRATGLNFRDVLNTLDMYPGDAGGLGHECSGVVSAVGAGVTRIQPGDAVLALASDCFASYAVAYQEFVMPKPTEMSFEQAAAIPITYLTAEYALTTLGHIQPGEKVLIHAAAGGVGLAAVQLAQLAGAEIFATAGSPEKRALLRALGVQHVLDSRSLDFAGEIMNITGGQGVQIILNSLADNFIPRSFDVLQRGGRFLEIGKRGIWTHEQVNALGKEIDYHIIYLGDLCEREPALIETLFRQLMQKFSSGALQPPRWRAFPLSQATEAFRFMAQAKHVGKIVLTQPPAASQPPLVRPDQSYLITGGLGGLGLSIMQKLVEAGARHIILVGRRAPSSDAETALAAVRASAASPVNLTTLQADLSQPAEAERVIRLIGANHPPLAGIIHAAGILEDALLQQQTWERFASVRAPKLDAAWHLHRLTADLALDFFVLFSAGAGWLGNPGQTGYAATNTAIDALVHYRRARGLPALSIAWGPWAEVGMAARMTAKDQERMSSGGLGAIQPDEGTQIFERLLGVGGSIAVLPMNWQLYATAHAKIAPRFTRLVKQTARASGMSAASPQQVDIRKRLTDAPVSKRRSLLQAHVREQGVRVLGLSAATNIDPQQPLRELGMDSLMAVELRNALSAALQQKLPSTLLFDYPTIDALTAFISRELWGDESKPVSETAAAKPAPAAADLNSLSDEEAEAMLLAELDSNKRKPK